MSKLLIVSGSYRSTSLTRITSNIVAKLAAEAGLDVEVLCARDLDLPIYDPETADGLPNAQRFRDAVADADGVIIGSPEYHGSFSGVLKNMIDYLGYAQIKGKPVAIVASSGGPKTGIGTLNALRVVFRALHAPVIVEQATVCVADFDPETEQLKPEPLEQLKGVVEGLAREMKLRRVEGNDADAAGNGPSRAWPDARPPRAGARRDGHALLDCRA